MAAEGQKMLFAVVFHAKFRELTEAGALAVVENELFPTEPFDGLLTTTMDVNKRRMLVAAVYAMKFVRKFIADIVPFASVTDHDLNDGFFQDFNGLE